MKTRHKLDTSLIRRLCDLTECFDAPCVVNAPSITQELLGRNHAVSGFTDEDEVVDLPGFRRWSLGQPVYVADDFDFVLLVAPDRRPAEVFSGLRVLTHFHYDRPVVVLTLKANAGRFVSALERFDVAPRESNGDWVILANFELP